MHEQVQVQDVEGERGEAGWRCVDSGRDGGTEDDDDDEAAAAASFFAAGFFVSTFLSSDFFFCCCRGCFAAPEGGTFLTEEVVAGPFVLGRRLKRTSGDGSPS